MAAAKHKLKLSKLTFLSLVDTPAQEPATVRLIKRAVQGDEIEVKATARIVKVGPGDDPLIYAWAFQCVGDDGGDYSDLQGDTITPDFVKAAEEFMSAGGAVDTQHNEKQSSRVAFAFPMDSDIATSMFGAPGAAIKTVGLMTAIRASSDDLRRVRAGELNGVSIMGTGIREAVKSATVEPCNTCGGPALKSSPACPGCGAYGKADDKTCAKCGKAMKAVAKGVWSTADQDSLPDSSFLYIEGGGKRDADGKTAPRNLRHFPYRDATGKVDLPHLRDAIGRIPQSSLPKGVRDKLQVRAEKLLGKQHDAAKRVAKQATLTGVADGHQHSIDLDDPADGWTDQLSTSYQTSAGAPASHCHAWTYDAATGAITIAADSDHTHSIDAVVPADVLATAARNESGERCPGCGEMAYQGCRFCPKCGCAMDRRDAVPSATTDAGSGSGPAVVVVTARAPDRISPPSGAVPTVKSEPKEPTAMPDLNDKIRELEASNARLSKLASLTDAQRAHHGKLNGSDAEAFLSKSAHERDLVLSEIEKANEVVYTSTVDGAVYRKSDDRRLIEMAKRADDAELARRKADIEKRDAEFAKKGDEVLKHFPQGTKKNLRARVMKALNAEFVDPAEYEEVVSAMKGHDEAVKMLGRPLGASGAGDGPESNSVQKRLDVKIDEYAKTHKLSREQAMARATASDPEIRALYNEAQLAGN